MHSLLNKVYKLELDLNLAVCGLFVIVDNFQQLIFRLCDGPEMNDFCDLLGTPDAPVSKIASITYRECVSTGAAGAHTRRSSGHHLLHSQNFEMDS